MRALGWMLLGFTACGPSTVVKLDDGALPVDDTEPSVDDDPQPDDTAEPEDTATPDDDTEVPEDTAPPVDTGLGLLMPVDYRIVLQLAVDPVGNVTSFTFQGRGYSSGVWVTLSDGLGYECDLVFLTNPGSPSADPVLSSFLSDGGYLAGLRLAPGTFTPFGPVDRLGNACGIDPASPFATDPHGRFLSDFGTPATPGEYLFGLTDTLSGDWALVLPSVANLRPASSFWSTSIGRTAFANGASLGVSPADPRRVEHAVNAGQVDSAMNLQFDPVSNAILPVAPASWNVDGRAASAVYLGQTFTMPLP
jgi:hypothetical protein